MKDKDRKLKIFPVIVNAFKEIALQHYYLKQNITKQFIDEIKALQSNNLINKYEIEIDNIEKELNRVHTPAALGVLEASYKYHEENLTQELAKELDGIKTIIPTKVRANLEDFTNFHESMIAYQAKLESKIDDYKTLYASVNELLKQEPQVQFNIIEESLKQLKIAHENIEEAISTSTLIQNKTGLLALLKNEIAQLPTQTYLLPSTHLNKISALKNIRDHLIKLKKRIEIDSTTSDPQLIEIQLKERKEIFAELHTLLGKSIESLDSHSATVKDSIRKIADTNRANYIPHVNAATELAPTLSDLCEQQTSTGNALWAAAAKTVSENLTPNQLQIDFTRKAKKSDSQETIANETQEQPTKFEKLLKNEIKTLRISSQNNITKRQASREKLQNLETRFINIKSQLEKYEKECKDVLIKKEEEEIAESIKDAKNTYKNDLEKLATEINKIQLPVLSCADPSGLEKLFNAKKTAYITAEKKRLEEEIKPLKQEISAIIKAFDQSELSPALLESYQTLKQRYETQRKKASDESITLQVIADFHPQFKDLKNLKDRQEIVKKNLDENKLPEFPGLQLSKKTTAAPKNNSTTEEKKGFWARHWPRITATTSFCTAGGFAVGAIVGAGISIGLIPVGGIGLLASPLIVGILGGIGAGIGAVCGFVKEVIHCVYDDYKAKKAAEATNTTSEKIENFIEADKNPSLDSPRDTIKNTVEILPSPVKITSPIIIPISDGNDRTNDFNASSSSLMTSSDSSSSFFHHDDFEKALAIKLINNSNGPESIKNARHLEVINDPKCAFRIIVANAKNNAEMLITCIQELLENEKFKHLKKPDAPYFKGEKAKLGKLVQALLSTQAQPSSINETTNSPKQ
ncbi:MAG: hypothetical protein JO149_06890 [Gammaproteobacteria bacterium]|nr:hypothetical protein [Gammaproteobacteria bacterium]